MLKQILIFVFFSLNLLANDYENQCLVCHQNKSIFKKKSIFKGWLQESDQAKYYGHIWLSLKDVQNLSELSQDEDNYESWFFRFQELTKAKYQKPKDLAFLVRKFYALIEEANLEVPILNNFFKEIQQKIRDLAEPIAIALENSLSSEDIFKQQFLPLYQRVKTYLETPFLPFNPELGSQLTYQVDSHLRASKIWPFFNGLNQVNQAQLNFSFDDKLSRQGELTFTKLNNKQEPIFKEEARFSLDETGKLLFLKPDNISYSPAFLNMVSFFYRGFGDDLNNLTGDKLIFLGNFKGTKRDKVLLKMKVRPIKLIKKYNQAMLEVELSLSEHEKDRQDSLKLFGTGRVLIAPNGLIYEMESEVKFRVRLLGLNLISGFAKDKIMVLE